MTNAATLPIPIDSDRIAAFCQKNGIRRLALFGSVLRDDFGPSSDVDVLVEFFPDRIPGWNYFVMNEPLEQMWNKRVDLRTAQELSRYWRDNVVRDSMELYVAS